MAPPSPSHLAAEEYELPEAGPSRPRQSMSAESPSAPTNSASKRSRRTFTLHPNDTSATLLFTAPSSTLPHGVGNAAATATSPRLRRGARLGTHGSGSPVEPSRNPWASFLEEGPNQGQVGASARGRDGDGRGDEAHRVGEQQVHHVPDFGHMLGINHEDEDHYAVARGIRAEWRRKLYLLMEEPRSGREAFYVHVFVTGSILFSAILTTLSTMPTFHTSPSSIRTLFGLDTTIIILFTIEYLARSLAHADTWSQYSSWATSFFPILDLLAILPYYIEVARSEDTSILFRFSILRVFRLLRVFRAFKYQNQMLLTIEVMYVAVQRSKDALVAISFFILLVLVLFSTLIYFAERGTWDANLGAFLDADGGPSLFDSIPQTAWFALVTMSTVGYGEVVPRSFLGKLLTIPLLMFGLLLIALPSFVLGRNFAITFDEMASTVMVARRASVDSLHALPSAEPSSAAPPTGTGTDADAIPLLPPSSNSIPMPEPTPGISVHPSGHTTPLPYPYPGTASAPSSAFAGPSRSAAASPHPHPHTQPPAYPPPPRMWDGYDERDSASASTRGRLGPLKDGTGQGEGRDRASSAGAGTGTMRGDLSNIKLAKNQLVLLEQIDALQRTVDKQGEQLDRLVQVILAQHQPQHQQVGEASRTGPAEHDVHLGDGAAEGNAPGSTSSMPSPIPELNAANGRPPPAAAPGIGLGVSGLDGLQVNGETGPAQVSAPVPAPAPVPEAAAAPTPPPAPAPAQQLADAQTTDAAQTPRASRERRSIQRRRSSEDQFSLGDGDSDS